MATHSVPRDEVAQSLCEEEMSLGQEEPECSEGEFEEFARSPIYQDTLKLHTFSPKKQCESRNALKQASVARCL